MKESDNQLAAFDPLEDLYTDAMLHKKQKPARSEDAGMRNALDAAAKRMKELYTLPENWERRRGLALIDKSSQTLIGNFSEYVHRTIHGCRRLVREHQPIPIDGTEVMEGYLGEELERRIRGQSWEAVHACTADLWMDELMVGAPGVELNVKTRLGAIVRVELVYATQFASPNGGQLLIIPAGTNVQEQLSTDSKSAVRKAVAG